MTAPRPHPGDRAISGASAGGRGSGGEGGRGASAGGRGSKRGEEPAPVAEALEAIRGRPGWAARLEGARIHVHWVEIAGEQLTRHAEPVRLTQGVLVVRAASPSWAEQVRYLASDLARRANAVLGPDSVRQVTVITGPLISAR